jgi:HK97 family phage major capsid protein
VPVTPSTSAFLEMLRAAILIGRIPGMTEVPANTSVNSQTGGGTYGWVGEGAPKPVTAAQFGTITVPFHKAAGIIVLTEELIRNSSPSAEALIRKEMIDGLTRFLDAQFITPAVAAVAGVNPAAITNGAATAAASGVTGAAAKADLQKAVTAFTTANLPLSESVWIMNEANAWGLSQSLNALAQPLFAGVSPAGGTLYGRPVVISNTAGSNVILVHTPSILYVNQGGLRIDVSREASIQMDSAPVNPPIDTTVYRSMFQENKVAFRVEHATTWLKARTAAVYYLSAAAYTGA